MTFGPHLICLTLVSSIGWASPLAAADTDPAASAERSATLPLAPGGTVRIDRTWGDVVVEAWDNPTVEVVVTATSKKVHTQKDAAEARARLEKFSFDAKAASANEVLVTGVAPEASLARPFGGKSGVTVRYAIKVPRTSTLVVRHEVGEVEVAGVEGDIDVANDTGGVHIKVPLGPSVAVETASRIGDVALNGELRAKGTLKRRALVGHRFRYQPPAPDRRVAVRVGIGSITIS